MNTPETGITERETRQTLMRLLPKVELALVKSISADPQGWKDFLLRLQAHFPVLFRLYFQIYGERFDFFFHIEDLIIGLARSWMERPVDLRELDHAREEYPLWFQSNQMLGGVCYVDLFAGNLEGIKSKIPYFKELGLTYLHLMPLFKAPEKENDGGYAVSSYREVHPLLGTMEQLTSLTRELRSSGISMVLDLVFNHTSDEHAWAEQAKAGNEEFQNFYYIFPDREMPDAYEKHVREIFPEEHRGAFTFCSNLFEEGGWAWTTFHSYQWDLNYANPAVFNRMAEEMLFLANQGVEVLRLDAVAFIWKQLGTNCENLPQAHTLIQAFNAIARIAAPALIFKSEAIVHPDDVIKYISPVECQLSYNPIIMALLWNSLATRKVRLLSHALETRFQIHPETAWVNYVRVHDDVGWTFSDEDAAQLGINGNDHRRFLNEFYRGQFDGSFARGLPFQENPITGDSRISGTCASLAGLEKALKEEGPEQVELAIRRILLIHGVILTISGIPLIYLGDEIGTLNDYGYLDYPAHARDSRWVHRPHSDWNKYKKRKNMRTYEGRVYNGLRKLIALRKGQHSFSGGGTQVIITGNQHVLGYIRNLDNQRVVIFANFSETEQRISKDVLDTHQVGKKSKKLIGYHQWDGNQLLLAPIDFVAIKIRP